jgi:ectoine hydroxylase-related dioxygenase (phytanoyl-CoA dioxygenase family)
MGGSSRLRDRLQADGYAVLPDRVKPDLFERLTREVRSQLGTPTWDYVMNGVPMYGDRINRAVDLAGKSPALLELLAEPWIDELLEASLLDFCDHALLSSASALEVCQRPGARPQTLHRDENNYSRILPRIPGGPEYVINLMIAGTEFTAENGATLLVPGSNQWPRERTPGAEDPVVALEMPLGGCGVWVGSTFHAAGVNVTENPRLGIIITFAVGWLRTIENHFLRLDPKTVAALPPKVQSLLGYQMHGTLGGYEWASPSESFLPAFNA